MYCKIHLVLQGRHGGGLAFNFGYRCLETVAYVVISKLPMCLVGLPLKSTGCPVKVEFHINNNFLIQVCPKYCYFYFKKKKYLLFI